MARCLRWVSVWLLRSIGGLAALFAVYGLAALALGRVPVNEDFQETPGRVPIAIIDNGVHVDIVMPLAWYGHDWRDVLPTGAAPPSAVWAGFGWGAAEFYRNTPTWADFDPWIALKAIAGIGGTTVRVHFREALYETPGVTLLHISDDQARRLAFAIAASLPLGSDGRAQPLPGPRFGQDLFLAAHGRYGPILTCNEWASRALATAGLPTSLWTPFPWGVVRRPD